MCPIFTEICIYVFVFVMFCVLYSFSSFLVFVNVQFYCVFCFGVCQWSKKTRPVALTTLAPVPSNTDLTTSSFEVFFCFLCFLCLSMV